MISLLYILSNIFKIWNIFVSTSGRCFVLFGLAFVILVRKIKFANNKCKKDGI